MFLFYSNLSESLHLIGGLELGPEALILNLPYKMHKLPFFIFILYKAIILERDYSAFYASEKLGLRLPLRSTILGPETKFQELLLIRFCFL